MFDLGLGWALTILHVFACLSRLAGLDRWAVAHLQLTACHGAPEGWH